MSTSSTVIFSMGSGERKRCSNMAPVRRLRSLAWMKARRFPGVRCSTLNTECRSLLCLMIMPGRIWVAGIDIAKEISLYDCGLQEPAARLSGRRAGHNSAATGAKVLFYTEVRGKGNRARRGERGAARPWLSLKLPPEEQGHRASPRRDSRGGHRPISTNSRYRLSRIVLPACRRTRIDRVKRYQPLSAVQSGVG